MTGPTLYARLMDFRNDESKRALEKRVRQELDGAAFRLNESMVDQLQKAYAAGVADGYAQAVADVENGTKS